MSQLKQVIEDRLYLHGAYKRLFDTPDGKTVLSHLMRSGYVFDTTYVRNDPNATALNEGSRRMVLSILRYLNKTPQQLTEDLEKQS